MSLAQYLKSSTAAELEAMIMANGACLGRIPDEEMDDFHPVLELHGWKILLTNNIGVGSGATVRAIPLAESTTQIWVKAKARAFLDQNPFVPELVVEAYLDRSRRIRSAVEMKVMNRFMSLRGRFTPESLIGLRTNGDDELLKDWFGCRHTNPIGDNKRLHHSRELACARMVRRAAVEYRSATKHWSLDSWTRYCQTPQGILAHYLLKGNLDEDMPLPDILALQLDP